MPILREGLQRIVGIGLLLIFCAAACAPAASQGCPGAINIGVSYTVDDLNARAEMEEGYQLARAEINQKGIGDGCKIELIYPKNQKYQVADVQKDVQDLVDQGALAILASQTNDGAVRIAQVSRYFNIPVVIPPATADEITTAAENAWNFQINPKNADIAAAVFAQLKASKPNSTLNVAILFEHSDYGESAAADAGEAALKNNLQIALFQRYSPYLSDYKEITDAIRTARPNMVYLISTQAKQALGILQGIQSLLNVPLPATPTATLRPSPTQTQTPAPSATPTPKTTVTGTPKSNPSATATQIMLPTLQRSATPKPAALTALTLDFVIGHGPAFTSREFSNASLGNSGALPASFMIAVPWAEDYTWPGNPLCAQGTPQTPAVTPAQPLVVRNIQGYVSLKLVAAGLDRLTQKTDWTVNEKKIASWQDMLRDPANLAEFRRALAQEIKKIQTCQFGSYLWPVTFDSAGQNQITPFLAKMSGGKLVPVYPKK